ncbi:SDR family NAD(P)-dependent oxidoreductase [Sphingobium sp. CCH11-B1]|jgi:7-alpha-hydroxysteroid dehydrogenase|uniref:SDR family NAD(P)-dependent oxidoreductase n=1 Tax=Sphingobium sp. CCH11-B1 TaxID=1768781 RepID=UPI00082DB4FC|nr:glucose 1-dehydrogenase [Sphingobium sp. CCH11-B1]
MAILDKFRLDGKVAVVTGGSGGIGRGIALAFADAGADVAIISRTKSAVDETVEDLKKFGHRVLGISGDVNERSTIPNALDQVVKEFGAIDIMVNNAGSGEDAQYTWPMPPENWDTQMAYNARQKFWGSQEAALRMPDGGRIINISSRSALHASPGFAAYAAANMAIISYSQTLAAELAPRGITVNCITPGVVFTNGIVKSLNSTPEDLQTNPRWAAPIGRVGQPSDIGAAALFFASPAAEWTTGQCLTVAGGR